MADVVTQSRLVGAGGPSDGGAMGVVDVDVVVHQQASEGDDHRVERVHWSVGITVHGL